MEEPPLNSRTPSVPAFRKRLPRSEIRLCVEMLEERVLLDAAVIENFSGGDLSAYQAVLRTYPVAEVALGAGHDGSNALIKHDGWDWVARADDAVQVGQGETLSVWTDLANVADGRAYFGFGTTPPRFNDRLSTGGTLSLVLAPNTNEFLLELNQGFKHQTLAAVPQTYQADQWYRLEVAWGTDGGLTGRLYDSDGISLLNTVTASNTQIVGGGISFRAFGNDKYFDTVTVDSGSSPTPHSQLTSRPHPVGKLNHVRPLPLNFGGHGQAGADGIPNPFQYIAVPGSGIHVKLNRLNSLQQFARVGNQVGVAGAIDTPNIGQVQVGWGSTAVELYNPSQLPIETVLLQQYMYRQRPGEDTRRLGESDLKNFTGSGGVDDQYLRPGEDDAYGAQGRESQSDQNTHIPIDANFNPVTGELYNKDYFGHRDADGVIHFDQHDFRDRLEHLLAVNAADIDPAQNPTGTRWFYAANLFVVGQEDVGDVSRWIEYRPVLNGSNFTFQQIGGGGQDIRTMPGLIPPGGGAPRPGGNGGEGLRADVAAALVARLLTPTRTDLRPEIGRVVEPTRPEVLFQGNLESGNALPAQAASTADGWAGLTGHTRLQTRDEVFALLSDTLA